MPVPDVKPTASRIFSPEEIARLKSINLYFTGDMNSAGAGTARRKLRQEWARIDEQIGDALATLIKDTFPEVLENKGADWVASQAIAWVAKLQAVLTPKRIRFVAQRLDARNDGALRDGPLVGDREKKILERASVEQKMKTTTTRLARSSALPRIFARPLRSLADLPTKLVLEEENDE